MVQLVVLKCKECGAQIEVIHESNPYELPYSESQCMDCMALDSFKVIGTKYAPY